MSRHTYTTIHDLKDIFCMIYKDHPGYKVDLWNYKDRVVMGIEFRRRTMKTDNEGNKVWEIHFDVYDRTNLVYNMSLRTVGDWDAFLRRMDDGSLEWDDARVILHHYDNDQQMHMYFTGSSNVEKEVNYNVCYDNPKYHDFQWRVYMKWNMFKFKANKILNKISFR